MSDILYCTKYDRRPTYKPMLNVQPEGRVDDHCNDYSAQKPEEMPESSYENQHWGRVRLVAKVDNHNFI